MTVEPGSSIFLAGRIFCGILPYARERPRSMMQEANTTLKSSQPTAPKARQARGAQRNTAQPYSGPAPRAEHKAVLVARALEQRHLIAPLYND